MTFRLDPRIQAELDRYRSIEDGRRIAFANLADADLAASARFWIAHCQAPDRFPIGEPVYDSTFWHLIVPELIRRLERR